MHSLVIVLPLAGLILATSPAQAQKPIKRDKPAAARESVNVRPQRPVYDDDSRWYPNDANQLKFGSRIWWDQMVREDRIGRPDAQ
jgi:hypothetical protein